MVRRTAEVGGFGGARGVIFLSAQFQDVRGGQRSCSTHALLPAARERVLNEKT